VLKDLSIIIGEIMTQGWYAPSPAKNRYLCDA